MDCSTEERHANEESFFFQGVWPTLLKNWVGIDSLKSRLSGVLRNQIIRELPSLMHDVRKGIEECQNIISRLGTPRVIATRATFVFA